MNAFPEKYSVSKTCRILPKCRTSIKFKVNPGCVISVILQLILCQAGQVLSTKSDIAVDEQICTCANVFIEGLKRIYMQERLDFRDIPENILRLRRSCCISCII